MEPEGSLPHSQVPITVHILSHIDPVHVRASHFLKIHLNIILPFTPGSSKWSLSLRFPHQYPVYPFILPHTCYMPRPSPRFDHLNNTGWVQIINPLTSNDPYSGRTAPLTSKRCILCTYSTNIDTEYFKHDIYSPFFSLQNAVCFIILTYLVPVFFSHFIYSVC